MTTAEGQIALATPTRQRPDLESSNSSFDKRSIASSVDKRDGPHAERLKVVKSAGVVRMEAIARAGDSKSGKYTLALIAVACYAMYWIVSWAQDRR